MRYIDDRSETLEYDPAWLPRKNVEENSILCETDLPSSEIILELGSGMGVVGLAAARSLREHMRITTPSNGSGGHLTTRSYTASAQVVLTDLPEVCTLLQENVLIQMEEWTSQEGVQNDYVSSTQGATPNVPLVNHTTYKDPSGRQGACPVEVKIRKLAWGDIDHVHALSTELKEHYMSRKERPRLTILCSDLVRSASSESETPNMLICTR